MPYAFYLSPRESTSFPKSLFCLAGSLPRDRAPTLHPKPAAGLGELTPFPKVFPILLRSVFPLFPPLLPHISWTLRAAPPPVRVGAAAGGGGGGGWGGGCGGSSTAQIWCFRAPDQLPIGIVADPCNYRGGKKYNNLCKTQNCLKGVWVWRGVPRAGACRWVGEAVAGLSRRTG